MVIGIFMPALSPTMQSGILAKWLKKVGDKIEPGTVIAEIETDKATMEVEAVDSGELAEIIVLAGSENVKVNSLIGVLREAQDTAEMLQDFIKAHTASQATTVEVKQAAEQTQKTVPELAEAQLNKQPVKKLQMPAVPEIQEPKLATVPKVLQGQSNSQRVVATPLARKLASQKGVDLANVRGTGPNQRITKQDVLAQQNGQQQRHPELGYRVKNSRMRQVIAERLCAAKQHIPHFYLDMSVELEQLLATRAILNQQIEQKISINDFIVKAVARTLKQFPALNASWDQDEIIYYNNIDVAVAVAIPDGIITPIVQNADQLALPILARNLKDLIARARSGTLQPAEYQGGGISISNLGMYGIKRFKAIINPPQSSILAIGASEVRPVVRNGQITQANMLDISFSCDHRVVDGAIACEFLAALKQKLQQPAMLFI